MMKLRSVFIIAQIVFFFLVCPLSFAGEIDNWDDPLEFPELGSVNGYFNDDTPVNYFILSASGDGQYVISHNTSNPSVYVQLFAANPKEGGGSNIIPYETETGSSYYALRAGQYKIRVTDSTDTIANYTLSNSYAPPTFPADDELNDTADQALPLLLDGEVYGHHGYAYDAWGGMPVHNSSDILDVWEIETDKDGYLIVDSALAETLDMTINLYDADGQLMVSYYESDTLTNVEYQLAAGTYYVKTDYDSGYGSYKLTTTLENAALANDAEPNDETTTATELPVGEEDAGHIGFATDAKDSFNGYYRVYDTDDYWRITTIEDGILSVTTTAGEDFEDGPAVHLNMYSEDGKLMHSNYNSNESMTMLSSINVAAGTYYVDVELESGFGSYGISCELSTADLAADTEPNGTKEDAEEVTLEEPVTGHLGFITETRSGINGDYNVFDTDDYWKVLYDKNTVLELTLTAEADFEDTLSMYIYVYNEDKKLIGSNYESSETVMTIDPLARAAGHVYVCLKHVNGYGSYTLSAALSPAALPDDAYQENPNDVIADATQLPANNIGTGHLGFTKQYQDNTDYWTFYASKEDTLYVTAVPKNEFGEGPVLYLNPLKESVALTADYNYDNGDTVRVAYYVTPGTYNAGVFLRSGYGSYTLTARYPSDDVVILTETLDHVYVNIFEEYTMQIEVAYEGAESLSYEILDGPDWISISDKGLLFGTLVDNIQDSDITLRAFNSVSADTLTAQLFILYDVLNVEDTTPEVFAVSNAFPNPFNACTTIRYEVPVECEVRLEIYDIFGRRVAVLAEGRMSPGIYDAIWDSRSGAYGQALSSGVYLYRFTAQRYTNTGKIMLLQ